MEKSYDAVKKSEATLVNLLTRTTPMWTTGVPLTNELIQAIADASTGVLLAVSSVNSPSDQMTVTSTEYQRAISQLRIAIVTYQHGEPTVRTLQLSIDQFDRSRALFHIATEDQIENYIRSLFAQF